LHCFDNGDDLLKVGAKEKPRDLKATIASDMSQAAVVIWSGNRVLAFFWF
jgi:hypothetical protein